MISGADRNKDQSYFLCQLTQDQLAKTFFPVGHLQKSEVRKIAKEFNLVTAEKRLSRPLLCGKGEFTRFLQQQLQPKKGKIIEIPEDFYNDKEPPKTIATKSQKTRYQTTDGKIVGTHQGAHFLRLVNARAGRRRNPKPLFVIDTDVIENVVYVGLGKDHPGLLRQALKVNPSDVHWVREDQKTIQGKRWR